MGSIKGIGVWLGLLVTAVVIVTRLQPTRSFPVAGLRPADRLGIAAAGAIAPNFIGRQLIWYALGTGVIVLLAVSPLNLDLLRRYRYTLLLGGIVHSARHCSSESIHPARCGAMVADSSGWFCLFSAV